MSAVLSLAAVACLGLHAQAGVNSIKADVSGSGLLPVSWAPDSPTLSHLGYAFQAGLEYDAAFSVPFRLEAGYLSVSHSRIAPSGELYRAWEGRRFAFLSGYVFAPFNLRKIGVLELSALGGGAITAADYTGTALAYAYPSVVLEPRAELDLGAARAAAGAMGPWLAFPLELMFRAGTHSFSAGLSLGWSCRLGSWL